MVWWNAVSKTATWGSSGRMALIASMPARFAGLCNGASRVNSRIAAMTSSSTSVEALNRSPPWTTRWPTPSRRAGPMSVAAPARQSRMREMTAW